MKTGNKGTEKLRWSSLIQTPILISGIAHGMIKSWVNVLGILFLHSLENSTHLYPSSKAWLAFIEDLSRRYQASPRYVYIVALLDIKGIKQVY